jgi:hypothetical protein
VGAAATQPSPLCMVVLPETLINKYLRDKLIDKWFFFLSIDLNFSNELEFSLPVFALFFCFGGIGV